MKRLFSLLEAISREAEQRTLSIGIWLHCLRDISKPPTTRTPGRGRRSDHDGPDGPPDDDDGDDRDDQDRTPRNKRGRPGMRAASGSKSVPSKSRASGAGARGHKVIRLGLDTARLTKVNLDFRGRSDGRSDIAKWIQRTGDAGSTPVDVVL